MLIWNAQSLSNSADPKLVLPTQTKSHYGEAKIVSCDGLFFCDSVIFY